MSTFDDRYQNRIPWVQFRNDSGQVIPPFSVIMSTGWLYPDPQNPVGGPSLSPFMTATMPGGQFAGATGDTGSAGGGTTGNAVEINPYDLYLTGSIATPPTGGPGPNGVCARPIDYPQLATVNSSSQITPGTLIGAVQGSWSLWAASSGFVALGAPQLNLCLVTSNPGPYLGQATAAIPHASIGPVDIFIGPQNNETDGGIEFQVYNRFYDLQLGDWCLFDWVDQGWEVVEAPARPVIRGTLQGILVKGGSAQLLGLPNPNASTSSPQTYTVYETLGINGGSYPKGTILDVFWNSFTTQWEVLQPLPQMIRGSLVSALSQGGSATITATDNHTYPVYEVLGLNGGSIAAGTNIFASYNNDTARFEVVSAGCGSGSGGR